MSIKSFVRTKTFRCNKGNKVDGYIEQDVFLMPAVKPSKKRFKRRKASLSDMDLKELKKYEQHKAKQNALNDSRAKRYCKLLAENNFDRGDIIITLTYDDAHLPDTCEAAKKILGKFIRKLRQLAKIYGKILKYIFVTEQGKSTGRLHHHGIINADCSLSREEIKEAWMNGFCSTEVNGNTSKAVNYFTKSVRVQKSKKLYTCSKNLVRPTVTVSDTKIGKRKFRDLTIQDYNDVTQFFESINPGYRVEFVYRYVPQYEKNQFEIDDDNEHCWRDGFTYIRVFLRKKEDKKHGL